MKTLWVQLRWVLPVWFIGVITNWMPENRVVCRLRGTLLRPFIRECGKNFQIGSDVTLLNTFNLMVGDDVYIAHGTWFNAMGELTLEDEVVIGPYVVISTLQHVFANGSVRFGGSLAAPVRIGRGTWLAAHAAVACGVTVGEGNLVAANACVVRDSPDRVRLGGVPAKELGENRDGDAAFHSRDQFLEMAAADDGSTGGQEGT